jgi:SAM-dependent methyltransferase
MTYAVRTTCRLCSNANAAQPLTQPILSLGSTPLADRFPTNPTAKEERVPLDVFVCSNCKLVQLVDVVDDRELFGKDYAFYTGASPSSIAYFAAYAEEMLERFPKEAQNVVEIASNDGTLLSHFQRPGATVLGIDPAKNVAQWANAHDVPTMAEPFSFQTARELVADYGQSSLILANNVLAHVDNLYDFMAGVDRLLSENGVFIFEVQYFPHLLFQNAFDHVYHEHRSFFSFLPLIKLLDLFNFRAFDVKEADAQGGSLRVYADRGQRPIETSVVALIANEHHLGLTNLDTYKGFQPRVDYAKEKLVALLRSLKAQGKTIYGYGASAKGNTLLNSCGIGPELLDCVVDLTPYKIGKYTPGSHIPVKSPDQLDKQPDYYLVQVWNYLEGILERETAYRKGGGKFVLPIPTPIII